MLALEDVHIGIIGLGYVGLPLAVEFGKQLPTIGFDLNPKRIRELNQGRDSNREVSENELNQAEQLRFSDSIGDLALCNVYIITVPTPIDSFNRPDLGPLMDASGSVATVLAHDNVVVYESTVYPSATEEICIPILEDLSGLKCNLDFYVGYSPERINPGDNTHRLPDIIKVTSGSTPEAADFIDRLYSLIIKAGTFKASSIKVAEAAKVIENTQRDVNIALINELALIFNRLGLRTKDVLEAAATKWNFLPFKPGLVGGHCIGVDPYYLTHKAQELGYHPEMILAGRRLNDSMGRYIASEVIKLMLKKRIQVVNSKILIMGLTFKENCPDLRNTKVTDIIEELKTFGAGVEIFDPQANKQEARRMYGVSLIDKLSAHRYDAVVLTVAHKEFLGISAKKFRGLCREESVIYDVKHILSAELVDGSL